MLFRSTHMATHWLGMSTSEERLAHIWPQLHGRRVCDNEHRRGKIVSCVAGGIIVHSVRPFAYTAAQVITEEDNGLDCPNKWTIFNVAVLTFPLDLKDTHDILNDRIANICTMA